MTTDNKKQQFDFILFGVTGFTGQLVAEYLFEKNYPDVSWAACARNKAKAEAVLTTLASKVGGDAPTSIPPVLEANLVCSTEEEKETLRQVVQQGKIVLTCAGPFGKYGETLVELCAQEGIHYADITGESDFVREMIRLHDATARKTGACIISHCGHDCIPNDMLVYEMYRKAKQDFGAELQRVQTFTDFPAGDSFSGGSANTAQYQLSKDRSSRASSSATDFDPLLTREDGTKSSYKLKNTSPKSNVPDKEFNCSVGPWIMAPVMVNCVRRSQALLGYNTSDALEYGEAQLQKRKGLDWIAASIFKAKLATGIAVPMLKDVLLPKPGEGPDRETMEKGFLTVHGRANMVSKDDAESTKTLKGKFHFGKNVAYLYTAVLLVETGMVMLAKADKKTGVVTPAVALGHDLTERILSTMDVTLEINEG